MDHDFDVLTGVAPRAHRDERSAVAPRTFEAEHRPPLAELEKAAKMAPSSLPPQDRAQRP